MCLAVLNIAPINPNILSVLFGLFLSISNFTPKVGAAGFAFLKLWNISIGKFETLTAFDDIKKSGITYHIPFSFGLELGKNNNVDLGFTYYYQPSVKQYVGALAVGITFPLN